MKAKLYIPLTVVIVSLACFTIFFGLRMGFPEKFCNNQKTNATKVFLPKVFEKRDLVHSKIHLNVLADWKWRDILRFLWVRNVLHYLDNILKYPNSDQLFSCKNRFRWTLLHSSSSWDWNTQWWLWRNTILHKSIRRHHQFAWGQRSRYHCVFRSSFESSIWLHFSAEFNKSLWRSKSALCVSECVMCRS